MKEEVNPEFAELYETADKNCKLLATEILKIVRKNDIRLLKKVNIRLNECIVKIKDLD